MPTIAQLKAKIQGLNKGKKSDIWKPTGKHEVRFLPYPYADDPFLTLYFHYNLGDVILCPKMNFGEPCEACDFCESLRAWKDEDGKNRPEDIRKQDWEIFVKIQPKARVFVPMVERGKEGEKAKFFNVTSKQADAMLDDCLVPDRQDVLGIKSDDAKEVMRVITDPNSAFDYTVIFNKPGENGNNTIYPETKITCGIKAKPLTTDKNLKEEILKSVKNIYDVYPRQSSEEVSKIIAKFRGENSPPAKPEGGTEYQSGAKEDAKIVGTKSIEEAFGDLTDETN